jgi:putative addiction module killer protein
MYLVERTEAFDKWLKKLKDRAATARIVARIKKIELGNLGKTKELKDNLCEFKIDFGPGYRMYYTKKGDTIILLIVGGDKSTQARDIKKAKEILKELR